MLRTLIALFFIGSFSNLSAAELDTFFKKADSFFSTHVVNGRVNYDAIKKSPTSLDELYTMAGTMNVELKNEANYQAFWINAYNLSVIKAVVDAYPINSPMDIDGFFDSKKHLLGGQNITLNYLENELLRKNFKEPRFHFVLVCGALSCPIIENFAYKPMTLNSQMETQAIKALNNSDFIRVNDSKETLQLSQIFKWYKEDFINDDQTLIDYVNKYRKNKVPNNYKISHYDYDWTLNVANSRISTIEFIEPIKLIGTDNIKTPARTGLQTFTPGTLLKKGQSDFTSFNTLYTQTKSKWKGQEFEGTRETFATALLQWTYGITESKRVNIGFDLYLKGSGKANGIDAFSAIDQAFTFTNTDSTRSGIGAIGARIKVSPIKNVNNFAIQSSFIFSPATNPEGFNPNEDSRYWIEWDRYIWWNQFFYDKTFGSNNQFQVFAEADLLFRFKRRDYQSSHLDMPMSIFLSYFPTPRTTIYIMSQHVPRFVFDTQEVELGPDGQPIMVDGNTVPVLDDWVIAADYTASGLGFKYQLSSQLNIELLYTNFWRAKNNGLGETYNIGIKYLTK